MRKPLFKYPAIKCPSPFLVLILTWNWARAITFWPFVIFKNTEVAKNPTTLSHEAIHCMQQIELGVIGLIFYLAIGFNAHVWLLTIPVLLLFYVLYLIFTLIYGYRNNPFEREAYNNSNITDYWRHREWFGWLKYVL